MKRVIRLATHRSPLAIRFANKMAADIERRFPQIKVSLVEVDTEGDRYFFQPPPETGGKCLYLNEVLHALEEGEADVAAHVIEEQPRTDMPWPRGWLSALTCEDGSADLITFTDLERIPSILRHTTSET